MEEKQEMEEKEENVSEKFVSEEEAQNTQSPPAQDLCESPPSTADGKTAESEAAKPKKSIKEYFRGYFTATRIAYLAVFTALAYILYTPPFEFYIIPAVSFLKIDFSNTFVMISAFSLGPVAGVVVGVLKEILHALTFSQTVGVGEIANVLIMLPYVLIPSVTYKKRKGIKTVLVTLAIGCLSQTVWSIPVNYTLTFPFYLMAGGFAADWKSGMDLYLTVWYWAVLFNFVKTVLISVAVMLLYKPLSRLIKATNAKFQKRK